METLQTNLRLEDLEAFDLPYTKEQLRGIFLSYDFIGYYLDEKIIGLLIFKVIADEATLIYIEVLPTHRQQGIARKMILEYHRLLGTEFTFVLEVSTKNTTALSLYESLGYRKNRLRTDYYDDSDGWEMILNDQ